MTTPSNKTGIDGLRTSIVVAASGLLAKHGAAALTTRGTAEAAGVQVPTIYRLFGDKEGLVAAIAAHAVETYVSSKIDPALDRSDDDPVANLRSGWQMHIDFGLENPALYALINDPHYSQRSAATTAGLDILRLRIHRLAEIGILRVDEQRAFDLICASAEGTMSLLLATPPDKRDRELPRAMFEAISASILTTATVPPASDLTALSVTFSTAIPALPALSAAERTLMAEWVHRSVIASR